MGVSLVWFRVLGSVEAQIDGVSVDVGAARQRAVLAVLLVEPGKAVTVDQLTDRVWGDAPPSQARKTLYAYLSRLRAVLASSGGVALARRSGGYALDVDPMTVDLHRFRTLAAEARLAPEDHEAAALWQEALALWRGEPFAGLDVLWLRTVAAGLARERLAAMLEANEVLLRRGEHARLLPELSAAAVEHPLDERLAGQLMLALYRCGRQGDALALYRQVHARLVEELGCDPGPALQRLHERILRQDPALALVAAARTSGRAEPDPPAQLPADIAGFTGREAVLRQLDAELGDGGPSAVVITTIGGCAGVGKTALAVHWAHRLRPRFPEGQLYLNLRGFDPAGQVMSPAEALRTLLELLQVPPQLIPASVDAQAGLYRSQVAGKRMLIVLDNARDTDQVRPLLPGSPGCLVVVTSRNQLAGLVAADGARPVALEVLSDDEARQLLVGRLGAQRLAAEPAAVDQVIAACAGLPLALAIVAARAAARPAFPLATFASELADASGRLDALEGSDPATNLRAVFSWSHEALSGPAARLFRLVGLHPAADIGLSAAASLAGLPVAQTRRLLAALTRAHLLTEHSPGRYSCHDLLRVYAVELAQRTEHQADLDEAMHRVLDYYRHSAYLAARLLNPHRQPLELPPARPGVAVAQLSTHDDALRWLNTECSAVVAVVADPPAAGLATHIWQLGWSMVEFLDRRAQWHDQLTVQRHALAAAQRLGDQRMQAYSSREIGNNYIRLGRFAEAEEQLRLALSRFGELGNLRGQGASHEALGRAFERQTRYQEALYHAQQALDLYRAGGHGAGEASVLNGLGWLHANLGDYQQSLDYCQQAVALNEELGSRNGSADSWDSLGFAHHHLGQYQEAIACFTRAVALFRELGTRYYEGDCLTHLGDTHHAAGDHEAAREAWARALAILDELDHPEADGVRSRLAAAAGPAG